MLSSVKKNRKKLHSKSCFNRDGVTLKHTYKDTHTQLREHLLYLHRSVH